MAIVSTTHIRGRLAAYRLRREVNAIRTKGHRWDGDGAPAERLREILPELRSLTRPSGRPVHHFASTSVVSYRANWGRA